MQVFTDKKSLSLQKMIKRTNKLFLLLEKNNQILGFGSKLLSDKITVLTFYKGNLASKYAGQRTQLILHIRRRLVGDKHKAAAGLHSF